MNKIEKSRTIDCATKEEVIEYYTEEEIIELEQKRLEEEANRPPTLAEEVTVLKEENISILEDVVDNTYRLTLLELGL